MASSLLSILAFLGWVAFTLGQSLPQAEMGSAITVDEDVLDSTADIAIATTAMADLGPITIEPPSSSTTEAPGADTTNEGEPANAAKEQQGDVKEEEVHSNANSTMTTTATEEGVNTSVAEDSEAPATVVPDLLATGVSFRDPGFIALSFLAALMLFMMIFV